MSFLTGTVFLIRCNKKRRWRVRHEKYSPCDLSGYSCFLFSFSSFPSGIPEYVTPELVPDDYYGMIEERISIPFALSETGWPSSGERPDGQYWDQAAQDRFIYRILKLTEGLDMRMLNWLFLSDPAEFPNLNPIFASGGLLENDGTPKQAFDTRQELFEVEFTESTN
jgi:hypothetical protein